MGCTTTIAGVLIAGHDRFPTYYEGEFASLRETVDVCCWSAPARELPANPRHAALYRAPACSNSKVSAVVDLYELKLAERRRFVKLFLESLESTCRAIFGGRRW